MKQAISRRKVPRCCHNGCNGLVKPDIVFFGEALPEDFHLNRMLPGAADLAIIIGTSLTVQPFASLPSCCSEGVPRLLLNLTRVGGLGSRADDVLVLGDIDAGVRRLASAIGWLEELEALFESCNPSQLKKRDEVNHKSHDDMLNDEVAKITEDIDNSLQISEQYSKALQEDLSLPEHESTQSATSKDQTVSQSGPTAGVPTSPKDDQDVPTLSDTREKDDADRDHNVSIVNDEKPQPGESAAGKASF